MKGALALWVIALDLAACHRGDRHTDSAKATALPNAEGMAVLFIGNSYTFVNDLPNMTAELMASKNPPEPLRVDSETRGGATLHVLWDQTSARQKIEAGEYRYVVIQGQSVEACTDRADFVAYAHRFAALASAHGATPVLYASWPRREGDAFYQRGSDPKTPAAMVDCLSVGAKRAAARTDMIIANVRDPWMTALRERPALTLYQPDGSHPTVAGTFLAANVLAHIFAPQSAPGTFRPPGLEEADARYLGELH